jgi:hypothetical protein
MYQADKNLTNFKTLDALCYGIDGEKVHMIKEVDGMVQIELNDGYQIAPRYITDRQGNTDIDYHQIPVRQRPHVLVARGARAAIKAFKTEVRGTK